MDTISRRSSIWPKVAVLWVEVPRGNGRPPAELVRTNRRELSALP